jgi:hypothetical protein
VLPAVGVTVARSPLPNERVSEVDDPREADALLSSALLGSDTILAKAILARAFAYRWGDIINAYTPANPATVANVEELWKQTLTEASAALDARDWLFQPRSKPLEIQMYSDATLIAMAG